MQFPYPPMMSMVQPPFGNFGPGGRTGMAPPLYVGDLDENIHEEYLHDFFSKFGPLYFVRIMKDKNTGKSRGFGYVNFVNPRDADTAKHQAQYAKLGRKYIRIAFKSDEFKDLPDEGNIFVKNIDPQVTPRDLHNHFTQAGSVVSAKIALDKKGDSLGYGYVQFEKKEHAEAAMNNLQNSKLKENELQLESFLSKEKRPDETLKRSLYVKDLPLNQSEDELKQLVDKLFSKFGEIESSFVRKHSEDKFSAFVCFVDQEAAQKAYDEFTSNPVTPEGSDKPIYVNWHQDRSERARQMRQEHYGHGKDNSNLYIRNIKADVTESQVKTTFEKFGPVKSVALKPWESAENKNQAKQGFISFDNADDARRAQSEGTTDSDIQKLYLDDAPYITMHQSRDNRDNFLNSKKFRKIHNNFMGDQGMRQMPYQMPGRGFQPFPMMPMMNPQHLQNQMRGQYRPQRGGYNKPQQGGYQKPQSRQQHNNYQPNQPNNRNYGQQQQQGKRDYNKVDNRQQGNIKGNTQNQEPKITDSGITVQTLKNKVGEFLQLDINKQRQILGELLFPLIKPLASDLAPKITGMLIDLSVLELSEILEFLEDPELLRERVFEARDLILEGERQ